MKGRNKRVHGKLHPKDPIGESQQKKLGPSGTVALTTIKLSCRIVRLLHHETHDVPLIIVKASENAMNRIR
jgi:hypothetical protein